MGRWRRGASLEIVPFTGGRSRFSAAGESYSDVILGGEKESARKS
jgi:hypothetical protein